MLRTWWCRNERARASIWISSPARLISRASSVLTGDFAPGGGGKGGRRCLVVVSLAAGVDLGGARGFAGRFPLTQGAGEGGEMGGPDERRRPAPHRRNVGGPRDMPYPVALDRRRGA